MTDLCHQLLDLMQSLFLDQIFTVDKLEFLLEVSQYLNRACDLSTQLRQLLQQTTGVLLNRSSIIIIIIIIIIEMCSVTSF